MPEQSIFTLHDDWGHAELTPRRGIRAGQRGTWTIAYRAGANGIAVGGSLRIIPPKQGNVIWDLGKVTAVAEEPGAFLEVNIDNVSPRSYHHSMYPVITVIVYGRRIEPGETIRVVMGDLGGYNSGRFLRARAQDHACTSSFMVFVDTIGNARFCLEQQKPERYHAVAGDLDVEVVANRPARFRLSLRQPPAPGKPAGATLTAEDRYENVVKDFVGTATLAPTLPIEDLPASIDIGPDDGGSKTFSFPAPSTQEPVYIAATDWQHELIGTSNPLAAGFHGEYRAYFGDLHVMTGQAGSAGMLGGTEEALLYARDDRGLDFSAVTNSGAVWEEDAALFAKYHEPHRFVTMPAREVGFKSGHKNAYVLDEFKGCPVGRTTDELFEQAKKLDAMIVSHHPNTHSETDPYAAWGAVNLDRINPELEPVIEICQTRGSFEREEIGEDGIHFGGFGSSIQSALARGLRLGFIGGTDNHRARPGSSRSNQSGLDADEFVNGGLTCVLTKELTREAIWEALWARRCYATTSHRTLLDFRVNDRLMGRQFRAEGEEAASPRKIRVRAAGTTDVASAVVVRNGEDVYCREAGGRLLEFEWEDADALSEIASPSGVVYYYVRVVLEDGNLAWASPVWIDV